MKTAIIIPTVPGNEIVLKRFLDDLDRVLEGRNDYEIIIELNNWIGFGTACNNAIKRALLDSEINSVITTNDDMMINETGDFFLDEMRHLSTKYNGIVVPPSLFRHNHVAMGFCYFPRKILEDVGLFDEQFKILEWEDVDLSIRILEKGYTLNQLSVSTITHTGDDAAHRRMTPEQIKIVAENRERFFNKWRGTRWEDAIR